MSWRDNQALLLHPPRICVWRGARSASHLTCCLIERSGWGAVNPYSGGNAFMFEQNPCQRPAGRWVGVVVCSALGLALLIGMAVLPGCDSAGPRVADPAPRRKHWGTPVPHPRRGRPRTRSWGNLSSNTSRRSPSTRRSVDLRGGPGCGNRLGPSSSSQSVRPRQRTRIE